MTTTLPCLNYIHTLYTDIKPFPILVEPVSHRLLLLWAYIDKITAPIVSAIALFLGERGWHTRNTIKGPWQLTGNCQPDERYNVKGIDSRV